MGAVQTDIIVNARPIGLTRVQREIRTLYSSAQGDVRGLTTSVQRFGHHTFTALAIFKGLAIYRGFGMLTQQLAEGVQKAIEFEKAMANVNSLLLAGETELREYADFAAQLGQELPLTMQAIAEGMYDIVSAGILAKEEIKAVAYLAGTAAVAGVSDLRIAVQAGIGTMNAFGKTVEDLEHIYDVHFMTVKMGILTYEQLAQVLGRVSASAALAGQQMETANAALVAISRGGFGGVAFREGSTRVVRFFQELSDPATHKRLRELGVAVYDSFGNMRNAIDIVTDLQAELAMMTAEASNEIVNQTFTNIRSAQGFQVLSQQIDIWREAQMKAIFSAGAMTAAFEKQKDTVSATLTKLQNMFTNFMRSVVAFLAPALDRIAHIFDAMGKNMVPLVMMIGVLSAKYIGAAIASKIYMSAEQMRLAQQKLKIITTEQEALAEERLALTSQHVQTVKQKGIWVLTAETQARLKRIYAIETETMVLGKATIAAQQNISMLAMQRMQTITMTGAILGMAVGFYALSKEGEVLGIRYRDLGAAVMGFTSAMHVFAIILPVITSLTAAKTAATVAGTTATWGAVIAQSALSGGWWALAAAAGVAIAIGVMTASMVSVSGATDGATESVTGLTNAFDSFEGEQKDLEAGVKALVNSLIDEGRTIDFVAAAIDRYVEARRGLGAVGAEALAGLAEQRFAMIGGQAVVAPRFAPGVEEFAVTQLGLTAEEYAQGIEGYTDAIIKAQEILLGLIETEEDWWEVSIYAAKLFGEEFGGALVTVWQDYGQQLQRIGDEQSEFFEQAQKEAKAYAETIRKAAVAGITPVGTKTKEAYKAPPPWGWLGLELAPAEYFTQEDFDRALNKELSAKGYYAILDVANYWMGIGDITKDAMEEVAMTAEEAFEAIQENVGAWVEGLGDAMKIEDMIETMIGAGDQLDAAGFYFGDVAGNWDALGEKWAQIQKMWMGLQMMQTLMGVVDSLANLPEEIATEMRPVYEPIYEEHHTLAAMMARMKLIRTPFGMVEFQRWQQEKSPLRELSEEMLALFRQAMETKTVQVGEELVGYEPITTEVADSFAQLRVDIYNALLPVFGQLGPELAGSLAGLLGTLLGDLGQPGFWDALFEDTEEAVVETIEEMADKFIDTIRGAGGFSDAIESFVEHGAILEDAGYYFKEVASGWEMLGEEWARIQTYFKVSEMINAFIQSAKAMEEYGVTLPAQFQENMFGLMQLMATQVLPDFQNVIDELIGSIGSADFWDALAEGMSEAQITQSNSITLAPYIVISERADAEEIMQLIHDSLVEEAKRAGFTWGGG